MFNSIDFTVLLKDIKNFKEINYICDGYPSSISNNEYLLLIKLDLVINNISIKDSFEYNILSNYEQ